MEIARDCTAGLERRRRSALMEAHGLVVELGSSSSLSGLSSFSSGLQLDCARWL